jgi:hypothetical protein
MPGTLAHSQEIGERYMKVLIILLSVFILFSCQTDSKSVPAADEAPVEAASEPVTAPVPRIEPAVEVKEEPFDPQNVPREMFENTLQEVQEFIMSLNSIIRDQKYDEWLGNLSQEYIDTYGSPEYLKRASEDPRFKSQRIVLNNLRDYFIYNVAPSRLNVDNDVDDIEFITPRRVKAFTVNARGQRLRLYELEKDENGWKVIN